MVSPKATDLDLPLIRQKSKIFATFPKGEGLRDGRPVPYKKGEGLAGE